MSQHRCAQTALRDPWGSQDLQRVRLHYEDPGRPENRLVQCTMHVCGVFAAFTSVPCRSMGFSLGAPLMVHLLVVQSQLVDNRPFPLVMKETPETAPSCPLRAFFGLPLQESRRIISESNVPQARCFPVGFTDRQVSGGDSIPTGLYRTVFFNPNHRE